MSPSVVATLLLILVLCWPCNTRSSCPYSFWNVKNNCYGRFRYEVGWKEAEARCKREGGHLASIWYFREMEFIESLYMRVDHWIGLSRNNNTDEWKWSDGSIYYPEYWGTFQARNDTNFPQCIALTARTRKWKIDDCQENKYFICKYTLDVCLCPPPCRPTTTAAPALQTTTRPLSTTTSPPPTCPPCASSARPYITLSSKPNTTAVPQNIWAPEICKMSIDQSTSCASDDPTCSCLLAVLANPNGSIQAAFNDGLGVNRSVVIRGQANSNAERLIVKLLLGKEDDNMTALQLNFHFGNKSIVLNSQADKKTTQQTVNASQPHQFGPGLDFKIDIQCGNNTFNMTLDDNVQLALEHQLMNLRRIKWLEVWHVLLSSVQLM
ncbi:uncharacterized protein LOC133156195 isoform X1 [Syngnathus typhle]|uniref:uncharacterized protein LOC133156195 isoform X1 n=2 Tax=Syngnathus typhle TaxID=161592 RepID=UPI002A6B7690|nr:uncharacterized protein LOC133156195 isoform X1 [Syngnathus typhle]XP_061137998.1 uncharacterized protein LOC133156195 isoform X1 [Syngnathus typhle]